MTKLDKLECDNINKDIKKLQHRIYNLIAIRNDAEDEDCIQTLSELIYETTDLLVDKANKIKKLGGTVEEY